MRQIELTTKLFAVFVPAIVICLCPKAISNLSAQESDVQLANARTELSLEAESAWEQNLGEAIAKSKDTGLPIMLVFSGSDWCFWCQRLDQEVLRTSEFGKWSSESVIKLMVDFPQGHRLPENIERQNNYLKQYFASHVEGFPTVLLVNAEGKVVGKSGYVVGGPEAWIRKIDASLKQLSVGDETVSNEKDSNLIR